jgi:hypothetical protein
MTNDYKPPRDDADTFATYKAHYEGERKLKPDMLKAADRALTGGATVGEIAAWTGLTPEVFRRRARALGVERKRPPTVGKLSPAATAPAAPTPIEEPEQKPAVKQRRRAQPEAKEGRPLTDEEAKTLAELARSRATPMQLKKLEQNTEMVGDAYKDFTTVHTSMDMGLLTHEEVYGDTPVRPVSSEETSG